VPSLTAFAPIQSFHLRRSFMLQSVGRFDPTATWTTSTTATSTAENRTSDHDSFDKVFHAPGGLSRVRFTAQPGGVHLQCDGPDAEALIASLLAAFRADDGHDSFAPAHPLLHKLHRENPGVRLIRMPWLFDIACSAVLQQRVRFVDACRDWRHIATRHGTPHPESGLIAFPSAAMLAAVPLHALQSLGIDAQRSRALLALARETKMYPLRAGLTYAQLRARLSRIHGIGPWTVETTLGFGAADPDSLPLGDLYLPHVVAYALANENPSTDARMVELLEPYRPHRFRIVRLLFAARIAVPRV
jgi:3-methyladenine DNA glycosylase/8-oxoguanine DNA glycosylase